MSKQMKEAIESLEDAQVYLNMISAKHYGPRPVGPSFGQFQHFGSREELEAHLQYVSRNAGTLPF